MGESEHLSTQIGTGNRPDRQGRREQGAYYTSEENIGRVIDPLFMDELRRERESCRGDRRRLAAFQGKLTGLAFLDPACGCGNFLILIYRRLRELELDVVSELCDTGQRVLDVSVYCRVSLSQLAGIEIDPGQARDALRSLEAEEEEMDRKAAELFGTPRGFRSSSGSARILAGNALTMDWSEAVGSGRPDYIVGNPPFLGARLMSREQKRDVRAVFGDIPGVGNLDYVTAWYRKTAEYIRGTDTRAAFVSTNSICQGEQAALLWRQLAGRFGMGIDFARRTFVWNNSVKGEARVHCVIVGFSDTLAPGRGGRPQTAARLYDGDVCRLVPHLNAYLVPAPDEYITARRRPLCPVPEMVFGSMANDGGHLILDAGERDALLGAHPELGPYIRPFLGSSEFIGGTERFCLWFAGGAPREILDIPEIAERLRLVAAYRGGSRREGTRRLARRPELFAEIRQPESGNYILVPRVSSARRDYIPMGFVSAECVVSDAVQIIPGGDEALFALLTSRLHMIWVRAVAGRLKSDFRYSVSLVYNNFPFPELSEEQRESLAASARRILAARRECGDVSPETLYDPERMPASLREAHRDNDRLAEQIFGLEGKNGEEQLVALFTRCLERTAG